MLVGGGVVAALALLYLGDLALSSGSVPRGVTVEGVPVGGLAFADAEQTLRAQIEPRTTRPVPVTVGDATSTINAKTAGLAVDWPATIARAEHQPLDPVTRIASFFTTRETGVVTKSDPAALEAALSELKPAFDKPAVEGNVRFEGTTPQPVQPVAGQELDVPAAASALTRDWASGRPVALPLRRIEPTTTSNDVTDVLAKVARPAVAAPITITGENDTSATLAPQDIAAALTFRPDPAAGLVPELNQDAIAKVLRPQLAASETPGRDATLDFTGTIPVVVPSQDGRGVDYPATVKALLPVLTAPAPRQLAAVYGEQPAKLTTEGLSKLGISAIIGEFTTRGFAADSGMNIKRAADQINGTIVQPGATFSLNAATNPRDGAHGYIEAGIIEDGHPARGIGGGVSQVATTLYNAAYFAGMTNVEHKEHSFYISRYPRRPRGDRVRQPHRPQVPQRQPHRGHDPDGVGARLDHGADLRDEALRRHVDDRAAQRPDRPEDRDDPGRRAVHAQQGRAGIHGHRHPNAEGHQHRPSAHRDPHSAVQPVADHRMR